MNPTVPSGDYRKYNSDQGISTKVWGPALWDFLFCSIMGRYPMVIDQQNVDHQILKKEFKQLLSNLGHFFPCIYCRQSYKVFIQELPVTGYLDGRIQLMYWLYLVKDKVNRKLIIQEVKCFKDLKDKIKQRYSDKKITKSQAERLLEKERKRVFYTKSSPAFKKVLNKYEAFRAGCSPLTKSCSKLLKKN